MIEQHGDRGGARRGTRGPAKHRMILESMRQAAAVAPERSSGCKHTPEFWRTWVHKSPLHGRWRDIVSRRR